MAGCWASGLPEAREDTAFGRRHHGLGGTLAWYSLVHDGRAAAIKVGTVGCRSLSNESSYNTGFSTVAPAKPYDGCPPCQHKSYEMFDDFNYTDERAPAMLTVMSVSLTSDRHDPNSLSVHEAVDRSDESGRLPHGGEYITAESQTSATICPEPEVSPCRAMRPA